VRLATAVRPGETVLARGAEYRSGGKGANQAMAAARHGAPTWLAACVGDDADGSAVVAALRTGGVGVGLVGVGAEPTGLAVVMVDDAGENSIVVVPGANHTLTPERVRGALASVADRVAVVIVQGEITADALTTAVRAAAERGLRCVINLAPFHALPASVLALADPLIVNEVEASELAGAELTAARAVHRLAPLARSVVVTAGADGAYRPRAIGRRYRAYGRMATFASAPCRSIAAANASSSDVVASSPMSAAISRFSSSVTTVRCLRVITS